MVFSSIIFLCGFLPLVLTIYYACPSFLRNSFLLMASLLFYAWGEPKYIFIMLFSTVFDYINGRLLEYFDNKSRHFAKKAVLICSIAVNLGLLGFFKYTDFIIENINNISGLSLGFLEVALPIGISFYTFQTLSYTIDVYRGRVKAQHNIIDFGMYISMFPQLIAGPIVRYGDIENQIHGRKENSTLFLKGVRRFVVGLGKKVIFANGIGLLWSEIAALPDSELTIALTWLGAIAFAFQIYFDFSGYSDMAIGLGMMFGFRLPENFHYPYEATSITEFWRRWHITLGTWFREYLYIPLGGNRKGLPRQIVNLLIVWSLTGLWHGAGWNFVLWGLYFFVILLTEKVFLLKFLNRCPKVVGHIYAFFAILVGWIIFAADDIANPKAYFSTMFRINSSNLCSETTLYYLLTYGGFLTLLAIASTALPSKLAKKACKGLSPQVTLGINVVFTTILLGLSFLFLVGDSYNPFLYFRF